MHQKQHLADFAVVQRPPCVSVVLTQPMIEGIDQFIRTAGKNKGIATRSDAIRFIVDEALSRHVKKEEASAPTESQPSAFRTEAAPVRR